MLMWYIIFVLLILFTGGGLLYLGTRAAKFVPTGSTPKRRLLIGLSAVILIFAVIAWLINLMNAVVCLLHFVFLWLVCDFIFTLVRRFRKRPFKRYYAGYAATALILPFYPNYRYSIISYHYWIRTSRSKSLIYIDPVANYKDVPFLHKTGSGCCSDTPRRFPSHIHLEKQPLAVLSKIVPNQHSCPLLFEPNIFYKPRHF